MQGIDNILIERVEEEQLEKLRKILISTFVDAFGKVNSKKKSNIIWTGVLAFSNY